MIQESLTGRQILVVEDEYFLVDDIVRQLEASGAEIVGPVSNVAAALALIKATQRVDGAVLDLNLQGEMAYPVADALIARGVPFIFATGYDNGSIPAQYRNIVRCEKPVGPKNVVEALFGQVNRS